MRTLSRFWLRITIFVNSCSQFEWLIGQFPSSRLETNILFPACGSSLSLLEISGFRMAETMD